MAIFQPTISGGGGSAPAHYIEKTVDANGVLQNGSYLMNFSGVTDIGAYVLYYAYYNNRNITGDVVFNVKTITGDYACAYMFAMASYAQTITSFSSDIESITGNNAFNAPFTNQKSLTSISFKKLACVTGTQVFNGACIDLTSFTDARFDSLKLITGTQAFRNAFVRTSVSVLRFPAITTASFGSVVNQFQGMLNGVTGVTLHFPSNVQSVVEGLTGYSTTTPFSATSGTVLFDLPATVILTGANSQAYERSPIDDTATALAWRKQDTGTAPNLTIDWTPFYTSGVTDPAVNDTIYSDSSCTTAVTTISAIA